MNHASQGIRVGSWIRAGRGETAASHEFAGTQPLAPQCPASQIIPTIPPRFGPDIRGISDINRTLT
jgi:hypothetical protein